MLGSYWIVCAPPAYHVTACDLLSAGKVHGHQWLSGIHAMITTCKEMAAEYVLRDALSMVPRLYQTPAVPPIHIHAAHVRLQRPPRLSQHAHIRCVLQFFISSIQGCKPAATWHIVVNNRHSQEGHRKPRSYGPKPRIWPVHRVS
jgi:hypothetical protein